MSVPPPKILVFVGEKYACVRITGRANFNSSIDFKILIAELLQKGYRFIVLDLTDCALMDSTFLGVLAGFGLKVNTISPQSIIELFNPTPRIVELLDNLGVIHLFQMTRGEVMLPECDGPRAVTPATPTREEITRTCLEAHQTLMDIHPDNVARFKDVAAFLADDLKKLKQQG